MTIIQNYLTELIKDHTIGLSVWCLVLTVFVSVLISIYSLEIRKFLSLPPQHLREWILKARLLAVESRYTRLHNCHNPFPLIGHISSTMVRGVFFSLLGIYMFVLEEKIFSRTTARLSMVMGVICFTTGIVIFLRLISFLSNFASQGAAQKYTDKLTEKIIRLRAKLGEPVVENKTAA
jgi:hypothetical protein